MSGLMGRSLAEDLAIVNNTITAWSQRSVRMIRYRSFIILMTVLQPKSGICVCSSHTKVSFSLTHPNKKRLLTDPPSVPLLNITNNVSTAQHGVSTGRKLGIAFGSIIAVGFFVGVLILLYLIVYHRLRALARTRSWKRHLNLRKLYLDHRCSSSSSSNNNNNSVSNTTYGPVRMVGSEEGSLSPSLSGGGDTLTNPDPFAVFAVDFTIPSLDEMSKSTTTTPNSMGVRRGSGWRNFEDYDFI